MQGRDGQNRNSSLPGSARCMVQRGHSLTDPGPDEHLRNSFYRKNTRSGRRMTAGRRLLYWLAVPLALALIRLGGGGGRVVRFVAVEHLDAALARAPALIPCYRHLHQLFCPAYL